MTDSRHIRYQTEISNIIQNNQLGFLIQYWKNWSTRDDLLSLAQWERQFGPSFCGLFVFAYNILGDRAPLPYEQLFEFRNKLYAFVAVRLTDYAGHARPISAKWDTLAMPAADFRRLARPLDELLGLAEKKPQA